MDLVKNEPDLLDRATDYGPPNKRFTPPFATLSRYTRGLINDLGEIVYPEDLPFNQSSFIVGANEPTGGEGKVGDVFLRRTTRVIYEKTGVSTWTARATLPTRVTNSHVFFMCPDGNERRAALSNIP